MRPAAREARIARLQEILDERIVVLDGATGTLLQSRGARDFTFDELSRAYGEAVPGLLDGDVDLLLVETVFDTPNAKAAVHAVVGCFDKRGASVPS